MSTLKEVLRQKIEEHRPRTVRLLKEHGDVSLGEVTIAQAIGGARGIKCLVTDISYLDPYEGIRFRGKTIPETFEALPKVPGSDYPYVEAFWYMLLTGDVPTMEQTLEVVEDWKKRSALPQYVKDVINALPEDSHPMVMFSSGILAMQRESVFAANYKAGKFNKMTCWEDMYEDASNLMAKLGPLGAYIYNKKYRNNEQIEADPNLDMGGNFAHMIGQCEEYKDVARMYFILHSDHESGNVSAHTTHLVA
ncbi:MAG: citrate (Si)-synthase, partial [Deltaproteobacteria bacterium]